MTTLLDIASLRAKCEAGSPLDYIFFWGYQAPPGVPADTLGPWVLSQWYPASFVVEGIRYATAEHWMMAGKAKIFEDVDTYLSILRDSEASRPDPRTAKTLGRQVRGFNQERWEEVAFDLVMRGNLHKFHQNSELGTYLRGTGDKILVEASPHDLDWGIGITSSHPDARTPQRWPGRNLLGFALMDARSRIRSTSDEDFESAS